MKSGIYKITSPTGKIYIGQSKNIANRFKYYKTYNCKGQIKIYASLIKHKWENHIFEILELCDESKLNERELFYIKFYDTFDTKHGLNLTTGGDVIKCSEETKLKRSNSLKGRTFSQEWKDKIGAKSKGRMIGFKHSEETKIKLKLVIHPKGRIPINKGKGMDKNEIKARHRLSNVIYRLNKKFEHLGIEKLSIYPNGNKLTTEEIKEKIKYYKDKTKTLQLKRIDFFEQTEQDKISNQF